MWLSFVHLNVLVRKIVFWVLKNFMFSISSKFVVSTYLLDWNRGYVFITYANSVRIWELMIQNLSSWRTKSRNLNKNCFPIHCIRYMPKSSSLDHLVLLCCFAFRIYITQQGLAGILKRMQISIYIRYLSNYFVTCINDVQSQDEHQLKSFQRKAEVNHEIQQLRSKMRDSQVLLTWFYVSYLALACTSCFFNLANSMICALTFVLMFTNVNCIITVSSSL